MSIEARIQMQKVAEAMADTDGRDYVLWKVGDREQFVILPEGREGPENGRAVFVATWGWRITDYLR